MIPVYKSGFKTMEEALKMRYQNQTWLVKLWRHRWALWRPFWTLRAWFLDNFFPTEEDLEWRRALDMGPVTLREAWKVSRVMYKLKLKLWYTEEEVGLTVKEEFPSDLSATAEANVKTLN